ncbi:MAG: transporter substrate-binding domain-containing protein, partial [Pseudoalteromonas rhizosphaerae]
MRLVLAVFVLVFYSAVCHANPVTFIAEDLPPYHFINPQGETQGALVDIAKAVLKGTALTAKFEIMPMARMFPQQQANPNAIMLSLLKTPNRNSQFKWLGKVYFADAYLVSLRSHNDEVIHLNFAKKYKVATI